MLAVSEARIVRSVPTKFELLPVAPLPVMVAVVLVAMTLVASLPAPLRATAPELAAATAAETATTSALMVALLLASIRIAPLVLKVPSGLLLVPEMVAEIRLPSPLLARVGLPPDTPGLPWVAPMKLRAMLTPMLAAPPLAPPAPAALIVSTLALIEEVSVALTVTVPFQAVEAEPRLAPVTRAWLSPVIVLKLFAPPPATPAEKPLPTAAAIAAAIDLALIVPLLVELTSTLPLGRTEAKFASSALVLRRIVLVANEMPIDGATAAPPLKLAAREAPTAVASMLAVSEARIVRSVLTRLELLPAAESPLMVALVLAAMTLVASLPAPLRATAPPPPAAATAAETATTSALMVALWLASTRMAPPDVKVFLGLPVAPEMVADIRLPSPLLAMVGSPPETPPLPCVAPMKLRAMLMPMLAARPVDPAATATLTVSTLALIKEVSVALTVTEPFQEGEEEPRLALVMRAWLLPVIVLKLLAPPPLRPAEKPLPTAAENVAAIDLELIVLLLAERTTKSPLGNPRAKLASSALVLRRIVLVASAAPMPTDTLDALLLPVREAEAAIAVASMLASSVAIRLSVPFDLMEVVPGAVVSSIVAWMSLLIVLKLNAPVAAKAMAEALPLIAAAIERPKPWESI